ncbi:MAG: hypothetical protein OXG55_10525 [bacterium]|nr:hypothetical protein [bacterium]MCY4103675.1 hypothetical protein [bacterium]
MQATQKTTTTADPAYGTLRRATQAVGRLRRGRADERGLTTLEWLLIVAAVAGLAALAVVLVQNVVDDTAEQISGSSARGTAAQVAAERITREKRALLPTLAEAQAVDTAAEVTSLNTANAGSGTAAMDAIIDKQNAVNAAGTDECARLAITYGDIAGLSAQWEPATVATKTGTTHIVAANSGTLNDRDNAAEANAETGAAFSTAKCAVTIPNGS